MITLKTIQTKTKPLKPKKKFFYYDIIERTHTNFTQLGHPHIKSTTYVVLQALCIPFLVALQLNYVKLLHFLLKSFELESLHLLAQVRSPNIITRNPKRERIPSISDFLRKITKYQVRKSERDNLRIRRWHSH